MVRVVYGVKNLWGEMSWGEFRWGELFMGRVSMGRVVRELARDVKLPINNIEVSMMNISCELFSTKMCRIHIHSTFRVE